MEGLVQGKLHLLLSEVAPQGDVRYATGGVSQDQGGPDDKHGLTALIEGELGATGVRTRCHHLDLAGIVTSLAF
jgi:hypothetical protein